MRHKDDKECEGVQKKRLASFLNAPRLHLLPRVTFFLDMSLLHYETYKYVVIKDRRLGVAYYTLLSFIILYILVQLVLNKGYLEVG